MREASRVVRRERSNRLCFVSRYINAGPAGIGLISIGLVFFFFFYLLDAVHISTRTEYAALRPTPPQQLFKDGP